MTRWGIEFRLRTPVELPLQHDGSRDVLMAVGLEHGHAPVPDGLFRSTEERV